MNRRKGVVFFLVLLVHVFSPVSGYCFAEPSTQDTVSVHFEALLSPKIIEHWNTLVLNETDVAIDSLYLIKLEELSELGAVFFQEHINSTEFSCLGSVEYAADSLYSINAQWIVDKVGNMSSMFLCITPQGPIAISQSSLLMQKSDKVSVELKKIQASPILRFGTYSGGSGTNGDPYQIATSEDLIELSLSSGDWDASFIQTGNIIFSADYISEDWNGDGLINTSDTYGMQPIGTKSVPFSGIYDGGGFRVKYLLIDNGGNNAACFGYCDGATLLNVGLAQVYVNGGSSVGALVGYCKANNTISNCYTTGTVSGFRYVGGLIGYIKASTIVDQSMSTCVVDGFLYVAGLVGSIQGNDVVISNSVSAGSVDGIIFTGGLIGSSGSATVENVYSSAEVDGGFITGGLIGNSGNGEVTDAYFDVDAAGTTSSAGSDVQGLTADEMADSSIFADWDTALWTFDPDLNNGLPVIEDQSDFYEPVETEFVGSGSWNDPDNWTNGVPDYEEITTVIVSGECDLDASVDVENLIIENGGVLHVNEDGEINVVDELVIVSDSTGTGEYYTPPTASVDTVEQEKYFTGAQWTFMSTPVTMSAGEIFPNLHMATSWTDPDGEYWVVEYSEDKRARLGSGMQDVFDIYHQIEYGKGYMVWVNDDQVGVFKHIVPNNSCITDTEFSSNYALSHSGWNLVGNPFTYTMTYDDVFDCEYNKANFTGAVYLWDGIGYKTWVDGVGDSEASVISPLEAFFIKRQGEGDGSFCMAKGDCECTAVEVKTVKALENESFSYEVLDIQLESKEGLDNTYLKVLPPGGEGREAQKIELSNSSKPIIYSRGDHDQACAVNIVVVDSVRSIPLSLNLVDANAPFVLSFSGRYSELYEYTLDDAFDGNIYPLEDSIELGFSAHGNAFISDRFSVSVKRQNPEHETLIINQEVAQEVLVDIVRVPSGLVLKSLCEEVLLARLFDMNGRVVTTLALEYFEQKELSLSRGIYVLELRSNHQRSTIKVTPF